MPLARHRARWTSAAWVVFGLALASCSGGANEAAPATSRPSSTLGQPSTTARPVDTSFSGQGSAAFCDLAKSFNDRFANFATPSTPAQLRASFGEARNAINQSVTAAPAEIKADMQVLGTVLGELVTALEKVNFNAANVDPSSLRRLQEPAFVTASQRLQAYLRNVCRTG